MPLFTSNIFMLEFVFFYDNDNKFIIFVPQFSQWITTAFHKFSTSQFLIKLSKVWQRTERSGVRAELT